MSSQSSHHPQEVLLAQFSLYVHKGGLKPDSFHFFLIRSGSSWTYVVLSCMVSGIHNIVTYIYDGIQMVDETFTVMSNAPHKLLCVLWHKTSLLPLMLLLHDEFERIRHLATGGLRLWEFIWNLNIRAIDKNLSSAFTVDVVFHATCSMEAILHFCALYCFEVFDFNFIKFLIVLHKNLGVDTKMNLLDGLF